MRLPETNMSRKFNAKVPVAKSDELLQKIPPTHELWPNAINATKLRKFKRSNEVTKMARTRLTPRCVALRLSSPDELRLRVLFWHPGLDSDVQD
jgi:hypothetical protein